MRFSNPLKIKLFALTLLIASIGYSPVFAEDLDSTNYTIEGATVSGGDIVDSTNYSLFSTVNEISGDPYANSTSYVLKTGSLETFVANTPLVKCFETDSDGSSDCESGPSYVNTNGLVTVCGYNGCYDSARFEIDTQNNPSDTLYGIQISDDNFSTDIRQIDGTTGAPKSLASKSLSDYKSATSWETDTLNITGLEPYTQYWIRITALHGDFTESTFSPTATATTALPSVQFDIDIATVSGVSTETSSPYAISFDSGFEIYRGGGVQTANNLIWLDLDSNAVQGSVILQNGDNGGLYSTNQNYTIVSATADLATTNEGFGLQNYDYSGTSTYCTNIDGGGNGELANVSVLSNYVASTTHSVGIVDTSYAKVYDADGPISACRMALRLKARASLSATADTDYTETITIVAVPRY
jgi:hypothetical protein